MDFDPPHPSSSLASLCVLLDAVHNASGAQFAHVFHTLTAAKSTDHSNFTLSTAVAKISEIIVTAPPGSPRDGYACHQSAILTRCRDYIALGAIGEWADVALHPMHSAAIVTRLNFDILRLVFDNTLGIFLNGTTLTLPPPSPTHPAASPSFAHSRVVLQHAKTKVYDAALNIWPSLDRARRHVLQVALSARYGNARLAPKAAMVAGAPLILFVCEKTTPSKQVVRIGDPTGTQSTRDDAMREWNDIAMGLCVFDVLEVDSASSLRVAVGSTFKDAVWNKGLSPTLIVLHLDPDTTLCDGVGVLRAICDGYGSRLHVEGPATAMFLAGREAENLEHDVALSASSAHSIIMDVASWFGVPNAAVVSSVRLPATADPAHDAASAPAVSGPPMPAAPVYPLWFLLQCSEFQRRADILKSACKHLNDIIDSLLEYAHLIEYRLVGCGAYLLLSYAQDASPFLKSKLNKAMLAHVSRHKASNRFHLQTVHYDGMDWICFSPLLGLESERIVEEISFEHVRMLTSLLVAAVKRLEIAKAGRAAFVASMKQCADVELVRPEDDIGSEAPLQFGALRVVPLGLAAGNGHWQRDSEMCEQVEKFTDALASCLETARSKRLEGMLVDDPSGDQKPMIYVGPVVSIEARVPSTDKLDAAERGARPSWTLFGSNSKIGIRAPSESTDLRNEEAREIAREAAEEVASLVQTVISNTKAVPEETHDRTYIPTSASEIAENKVKEEGEQQTHEGGNSNTPTKASSISSPADPGDVERDDAAGEREHLSENRDDEDRVRSPTSEPSSDEIASIVPDNPASPKPDDTPKDRTTVAPKPSPMWRIFWDRAFGRGESQSDSESTSLKSDEDLEDDYFRV